MIVQSERSRAGGTTAGQEESVHLPADSASALSSRKILRSCYLANQTVRIISVDDDMRTKID